MAAFKESKGKLTLKLILVGFMILIVFLLWNIPGNELSSVEGKYALQSTSSDFTILDYFSPDTPICYLFLVKIVNQCGVPMEWSLRLISIFSYLLLMALVVYTVRWDKIWSTKGKGSLLSIGISPKQQKDETRSHNIYATGATAVFMFSFVIVHKDLIEGCPHPLTALGLYSGWILWLELAVLKKKTEHLAWILMGIFSALIYLNAGFTGIMIFLIPLMIQRRPIRIWDKISPYKTSFIIFVLLLLLPMLYCWYQLVSTISDVPLFTTKVNTWADYFSFPLKWLWYLFPGSLLMWAPYCAALIPKHKNPLRGRFFRTTFLTVFLLIWLVPTYDDRNFILLTPIMAVMLGSYFWIIARQYGSKITALLTLVASIIFLIALPLFLDVNFNNANIIPKAIDLIGIKHLPISKNVDALPLSQLVLALATSAAALFFLFRKEWGKKEWTEREWLEKRDNNGKIVWKGWIPRELSSEEQREKKNQPLWFSMFFVFCSCFMLYTYFRELEHADREHTAEKFAENMRKCIEEKGNVRDETVVVYTSVFKEYPKYYYFMNNDGQTNRKYKIKYIKDIKDLPNVDTAYYLAIRIPEFINHRWTNLEDISPQNKQAKQPSYSIYKGTKETKQETTEKK